MYMKNKNNSDGDDKYNDDNGSAVSALTNLYIYLYQ